MTPASGPHLLALFQKRIQGDDALLELARLRFQQAGAGAEFYAGTPDDLERLWTFGPVSQQPELPVTVHLDRATNLLEEVSRNLILDFAVRFQGRVLGLVIHDQAETVGEDYLCAVQTLASRLEKTKAAPRLFIEYAAGLEPAQFAGFFERTRELESVSPCIDIGHVGIRQARKCYSKDHFGDVCSLTAQDPQLPELVAEAQKAVSSALASVLGLIETLGALRKPVHFHLHDGHPLAARLRNGVSDHLSFLSRLPIPFEYGGKHSLDPMYGPPGLAAIISRSLQAMDPCRLSFTLEIHPAEGRIPLGDAADLFRHWHDKTNAERMNYWLSVLMENHQLVAGMVKPPE